MLRSICVALLAVSLAAIAPCRAAETKSLLLIGQGPDGHPPATHEFMAGVELLAKNLESTPGLKIVVAKADEPWAEGPQLIEQSDAVLLYLSQGAAWMQAQPRRQQAFVRLAARGGGLSALHWALGCKAAEPIEPFLALLGACHGGPDRKYQVLETELKVINPPFPFAAACNFRVRDEFYYQLKVVPGSRPRPLVEATIDGTKEMVAWTWDRPDGGRSFGFTGLHFDENWKVPQYRQLVTQAVLWTLKLPSARAD